ncbi:MAG TPA: response regulator [Thermoanaerobaculia bacterium]|nr:response regulator [Thermoanaerobaculia bacterium]
MKRRILLADDSVTIQKVIELTFMDEDYEVRAVSNGDDAVRLLSEINPDFVIADVHMPGANGYEVCRRAKQLRPGLPVLLLVGTFEPFDEGEARAAGADSHLKKPFDSQELLQRVEELIAKAPSAPAAAPAPAPSMAAAVPPPPAPPAAAPGPRPLADWTANATPDWLSQPAHEFSAPEAAPPAPNAAIPEFTAEPAWSNFDLEPEPAPSPFAPPAPAAPVAAVAAPAHLEPFDHEPSFSLEPDPGFQAQDEPVFELEESADTYSVREDIFGAPSELSLDEAPPQDRYLAEEPAAPAAAGFNWSPEPEPHHRSEAPTGPWEITAPPAPAPWTAPEPAPPPEPAPEPVAPAAHAAAGNGHLSDDDVDRIARRVVELLGDRTVRDVAWEVIPDMAEVIIRDRLRELEAQVE